VSGAHKIPEVTPELLADLYDCLMRFGARDKDMRVLQVINQFYPTARTSIDPDNMNIVIRQRDDVVKPESYRIETRDSVIMWDTRVTISWVEELIVRVDKIMKCLISVDIATGAREQTNH